MAQGAVPDSLFPAKPAGWVTDVPGALDSASVRRIAARAETLRQRTSAEIAVAVLPTIGDYPAVDVAVAIGRAWGVGARAEIGDPRRNTGLVILLVPQRENAPGSGQIFISTGRGLEGIITDGAAGRVRDRMRPLLIRREYGPALALGVEVLADLIERGMGTAASESTAGGAGGGSRIGAATFLLVLFAVLIVVVLVAARSGRGGPPVAGGRRRRPGRRAVPPIFWGGFGGRGGGWGGGGFGGGGGGFGGFGGGGGFSGGGAGGRF